MRNNLQKGSALENTLIIVSLAAMFIISILPSPAPQGEGEYTQGATLTTRGRNSSGTANGGTVYGQPSLNASYIALGRGNASYTTQSYEEYITVTNQGGPEIDITGWRLLNSKSERPYDFGGMLRYFPSDTASIPQGTLSIGTRRMQNIVLKSGETAIITTGSVGSKQPYEITSFKENICTGYLEDYDYEFNPPLSHSCPMPANEPGLSGLEPRCRDFIKGLPSCQVPEFNKLDYEGEPCKTCVNGQRLSSSCYAFIKQRFNYAGCIANHSNDADFSGRTWRVYLGRGWEMWDKDYETISLFDRSGNLVDSISY